MVPYPANITIRQVRKVWSNRLGFARPAGFIGTSPGTRIESMHSILYKLSNPVMSFPVEWKGGALGFTLSSLVAGPNMRLMTVCGSLGGLTVDPRTGKTGKLISQVGRKRGLVRLASEQLRLRARNARGRDAISVVNAAAEEFVTSILMEGCGRSFGCLQREKRPHLRSREWKGHLRDYAGEVNNVSD
jgi:hypothetical protein